MSLNREIGFTLGSGESDDEEVAEASFLQNAKFVEYWYREQYAAAKLTFRKQLLKLASDLPPTAIALVSDSFSDLVSKIVLTRSFLTHLDPKLESIAAHGEELKIVNLKLGYFLWFHFGLIEYGIEAVLDLAQAGPKNARIRQLLGRSDKVIPSPFSPTSKP